MKKNMRKAIILALALVMTLTTTAVADTIVSPVFRFPSVQERPTEAPTAEPTAEPTEAPTEEPTAEPEVTVEPEVTAEPTVEPEVTAEPEVPAEPTVEPEVTLEPEVTAEPAVEPEVTAEPVVTEEPAVEPSINVYSKLEGKAIIIGGTQMVLTAVVEGVEEGTYTIQWQQSSDNCATWQDIAGANGHEYILILKQEHSGMYWRAIVQIDDVVNEE